MLRKQEASHQEELTRTQKDHQSTQLQLNSQKDLFQNLKLEKLAADKRQESQAAKICALERRLQESTNLMATTVTFPSTPKNPNTIGTTNSSADKSGGSTGDFEGSNHQHSSDTGGAFAIPRLGGKENPGIISTTKKCSICLKDSNGLMKKCECRRKDCKSRAHATCVQRVYAGKSIPGTPATGRVPVVLCCSSASKVPSSGTNMAYTTNVSAITPH